MRTFLLFVSILFAGALFGQKTKTNTAKLDFIQYPSVPVEGFEKLGIQVYTADLPFNKDTLRLYLGNMDIMKSDVDRMSKVKFQALNDIDIVGGEGDLTVDMAFGTPTVVSKEIKKTSCMVAKDGCVQYYYKVKYNLPTIVQVRNLAGVVNSWELNPELELQFANEQVEKYIKTDKGSATSVQVITYLSEMDLALAFDDIGAATLVRKGIVVQLGKMAESIYDHVFIEDTKLKLDIAYGSGKATDYTETETASQDAVAALESGDFTSLNGPISVWESWLTRYNSDDKKAAVNNKVAQGLHENLSIAYTFIGAFDKAQEHIDMAITLSQKGMVNENEVRRLKEFKEFVYKQENVKKYNPSLNATTFVEAPDIKKILGRRKFNEDIDFLIPEDKFSEISKNDSKDAPKKDIGDMTVEEFMNQPVDETNAGEEVSIEGRVENNMLVLSGLVDANMRGKAFPATICDYPEIKTIRAVNIGFTSLPDCMGTLVNLEKLFISSNNFTSLPDVFGSMSNLEVLDISNNNLKTIPPSLFSLTGLKKILISGNQFSDADIKKLKATFPDAKIK